MKKALLFSLVLFTVIFYLAGCRNSEVIISTLDDAKHARIGVMTGSTGEAITIERYPDAEVKSFDDVMDAVAAIKSGQVDAIVTSYPTAVQVSKKITELTVLAKPLAYENTAIALKKDNAELLTALNRIISELREDGTLESMKKRWLKPDLTPYEEVDIAVHTKGKVLKVGVSATREPFSFVNKNGEVSGHDGELARIIAHKLQRPIEFYNMKFMSLIPALQSTKVDLIITGMTATKERQKFVDFTQSYFANAQVMLVKKSTAAKPTPLQAPFSHNNKVSSLGYLDGKRIGVLSGSAGDLAARKHFPNATFQSFTSAADIALAIRSFKTDAFVYDKSVLLNLANKNPQLIILDEPVDRLEVAAALKKSNTELLQGINKIVSELKKEGILRDLRSKWIESKYTTTPQLAAITGTDSKEVLKMGTCALIEPFSFQANGIFTGLDIELSRLIGQRLGKKVEIIDMNFEALIPALQAGKIDFALSNFNVTSERKKLINFSLPYIESDISALVRRVDSTIAAKTTAKQKGVGGQSSKLTSIADLKNKRIGVLLGSAHDIYALKNFPNASILQYKSPSDVALSVKSGKVDAALFDAEPLREIMRQDDSLALLGKPLFTFNVGVGFKRDNQVLRKQFNQFLAQIKQNGVHADMVQRWMEKGDTHMPIIANTLQNGVLVVGVSDAGLPFTAVQDKQLVGFDIELSERFAAYLGKELRFANMEFGSLIYAVSAGKADMIASAIYITEERAKQINFSAAYYAMDTLAFALKKNIATGKTSAPGQAQANKFTSVADLKEKRIGVLLGSVYDSYAMEHYPDANILQYKSPSDLVLAVRSAKADAAIYNRENLIQILLKDDELALLGEPVLSIPVGIGFNKNNASLREQFNAFLQKIKLNGDLEDMVNRWINNASSLMPEIPKSNVNGMLVVGVVSDKGLPFAVFQENRLIGFDIELAERFGAYLGKAVKFSDMEFGNLIAAVSAGKIDMIDSTLMITDERKTRIDFSDPYYELGASVFVLRKNLTNYDAKSNVVTEPSTFFSRFSDSFYSNIIHEDRYLLIWDGLKTTVIISIVATLFGTMLGTLVCFMRMSKRRALNLPARIYINIVRGTPVLILLMLIFYVVFASVDINPVLVAIIAFGMNFGAYVSEIFRSGIKGIDKGQTEAGIAMGFTKLKTFVFIILPQTIQRILPVYKGEFISLVKMTSIVGYIAVQDLTKASDIIRARTFDAFFPLIMVAILYFLIAWILMLSLEYLERITDPKYKRGKALKS